LTKEQLRNIINDYRRYALNFLVLRNKRSELVPFKFNKTQEILDWIRGYARDNGLLERYLILKARQKGISTYWEGVLDWMTSTRYNTKAVVIGHVEEASRNLFEMVQRFFKHKPEQLRPVTQNTNERKIKYLKLDSEIKVKTAGVSGEGTGRSDTINLLHCTEVAFWNDAEQSLLGLLQAVPDSKNSLVVLETTAKGLGNEYHRRWQDVYMDRNKIEIIPNTAWRTPNSKYIAIFISWLIDDEYSMAFDSEIMRSGFERSLTDAEKELIKRGATLEHLNWRRYTIKDKCSGDEGQFQQEYPSTPEEAFLVTGRPVFDMMKCQRRLDEANKIEFRQGDLVPIYTQDSRYCLKLYFFAEFTTVIP